MTIRVRLLVLGSLWLTWVAAACVWVLWDQFQSDPFEAFGRTAMAFGFAVTALLLAGDLAQRKNAGLFALLVLAWLVALAGVRGIGWLAPVGFVVSGYVPVLAAAALLRFPRPRLDAWARRFVAVFAVTAPVFQLGLLVTNSSGDVGYAPGQWRPIVDNPGAAWAVWVAKGVWLAVSAAVFLFLMWRRWSGLGGLERRTLSPVFTVASALAIAMVLSKLVPNGESMAGELSRLVRDYLAAALGIAFAVSALRLRLAPTALTGLTARLANTSTIKEIQAALRSALSDPTVEIWYWAANLDEYVDIGGQPRGIELPVGRLVIDMQSGGGQPLARISAHGSLERHRDLVEAAVGVSRMALENGRLEASLRSELATVREARARLLHAGLAQRRQLERDLHDGAQQRLLAIGMRLGAIESTANDPATIVAVQTAREELRTALAELRDLAHGLYPASLTQGGLRTALTAVADQLPVVVDLQIPPSRWDADVESAAYLTACEGIVNAAKHAGPCTVRVCIDQQGADLVVRVDDDGCGSAALTEPRALPHLEDRLAALGGRLEVRSHPGAGTRLKAMIPCG